MSAYERKNDAEVSSAICQWSKLEVDAANTEDGYDNSAASSSPSAQDRSVIMRILIKFFKNIMNAAFICTQSSLPVLTSAVHVFEAIYHFVSGADSFMVTNKKPGMLCNHFDEGWPLLFLSIRPQIASLSE